MTMLVVGLYDQRSEAKKVIEALKGAGFRRSQVEQIEKRAKSEEGFFKSLFSMNDEESVSVDDLREMGISLEDAKFYAQAIRDGRVLLTVRCDDDETERVRQIMGRYRLSDYGRAPSHDRESSRAEPDDRESSRTDPGDRESSRAEPEQATGSMSGVEDEERAGVDYTGREVQEEFLQDEPVVSAEAGQEKKNIDDRTEAVTNGEGPEQVRIDELYELAAQDRGRFDQFEPDLRAHFDDIYGSDGSGFEEFDPGYRYGMALAEYEPFLGMSWAEVAPEAEEGWEVYNKGTWHRFRAAVEYGWNRIRGSETGPWPGART